MMQKYAGFILRCYNILMNTAVVSDIREYELFLFSLFYYNLSLLCLPHPAFVTTLNVFIEGSNGNFLDL
jgi:hypothetical protein